MIEIIDTNLSPVHAWSMQLVDAVSGDSQQ